MDNDYTDEDFAQSDTIRTAKRIPVTALNFREGVDVSDS